MIREKVKRQARIKAAERGNGGRDDMLEHEFRGGEPDGPLGASVLPLYPVRQRRHRMLNADDLRNDFAAGLR